LQVFSCSNKLRLEVNGFSHLEQVLIPTFTSEQIGGTLEQIGVTSEQIGVTLEQIGVTSEQIGVTSEQIGVTSEQAEFGEPVSSKFTEPTFFVL
jgi:hypothetical protein